MSGYPDAPLDPRLELYLGGEWTDVTSYAYPDGSASWGTITSGQPDGSQQPSPSRLNVTLDNADYRFSPRNAAGPYYGQLRLNTPARVSVASAYGNYLRLEDDGTSSASCPEVSGLDITGSIDVRVDADLSGLHRDVLGNVSGILASKLTSATSSDASWTFEWGPSGLSFTWNDSSSAGHSAISTAFPPWTGRRCLRVTMDASTGYVRFYTGPAGGATGSTWTQLGATVDSGSGATDIAVSTADVSVGNMTSGALDNYTPNGAYYEAAVYDGIAGSLVANPVFSAQAAGTASFADAQGNTWTLYGTAEISDRDYRGHFETASIQPLADVSGSLARVQAQLSGRLRRIQQGAAPAVESPVKRAVLGQSGSLYPLAYWPMEDAAPFGAATPGTAAVTVTSGTVQAQADSTFTASGPLPVLGSGVLKATVPSYGTTLNPPAVVRFLTVPGTAPASGTVLARVTLTGACTSVTLTYTTAGALVFAGSGPGGSLFSQTITPSGGGSFSGVPLWFSMYLDYGGSTTTPSWEYAVQGGTSPVTATAAAFAGVPGAVTDVTLNPAGTLTDTAAGHLQVQEAWQSLSSMQDPLNGWAGETAADRFARVCDEQGIACRVIGSPADSQAMGVQPRGTAWTVLRDCADADQGMIFEPRDVFGLGLRTRASMLAQSPAVTLDFAAGNLRGDLNPVEDDYGFANDVTAYMPDGTSHRSVLDDGSPRSVSVAGRYAASPPFTLNLADSSQLQAMTDWYLKVHSADAARFRNIAGDFGIPGAPASDMARLRPGDLVVIYPPSQDTALDDTAGTAVLDTAGGGIVTPVVAPYYQTADIRQLAAYSSEQLGPGRVITWDGMPSLPYD